MTSYILQSVEAACRGKTNSLCLEFKRGSTTLASIAATAALLGIYSTVNGIQNSFHSGGGSRSTPGTEIARNLGVALFPTLLGLFACVASLCVHRYIAAGVAQFRLEMETQSTVLVNALLLHIRRAGNTQPLDFVRRRLPLSPGYAAAPENSAAPTFVSLARQQRHGIRELLWPRARTLPDVEQVLERGQWIALACAALNAMLYYQSPYTALTFCIFMALSGFAIRSGSRLLATTLPIALLSLASSRYEFYVGFDLAAMVWRFTGILLVLGALRVAWSPCVVNCAASIGSNVPSLPCWRLPQHR